MTPAIATPDNHPSNQACYALQCPFSYASAPLTIASSSSPSPNRRARSHSDCVVDSTGMGSLYVKRCCYSTGRQCSQQYKSTAHMHEVCRWHAPCTASQLHHIIRHAWGEPWPRSCTRSKDTLHEPTCVSARAWSMSIFASAVNPDIAQPMCSSISIIFSIELGSCIHKTTSFTRRRVPDKVPRTVMT